MTTPLRVLIIEDSEDDTQLALRHLRLGGYEPSWTRVDSPEDLSAVLDGQPWDVILCDYAMPRFDAPGALRILQEGGLDIPFIIVSGKIGEETAVAAMKAGAHDYVMKDRLNRLPLAVERELREAALRREHDRSKAELIASERLVRGILENMQDAYIRVDVDGRLVMVSPSAANIYGYGSVDEMLGRHVLDLYCHDDDRARVLEELDLHGSLRDHIGKGRKKDGTLFWVSLNARHFEDSQGQIAGTECFVRDITERMRTQDELETASERMILATRAAKLGVWDWNIVNDELVWDDGMYALYGLRREDFSGAFAAWSRTVHPEDMAMTEKAIQDALQGSHEYAPEFRIIWPDGSVRYIQAASRTFYGPDGVPLRMVGINLDITERKLEAQARLQLEEQLRASQKLEAIGSLAGGVAHDFNNLLSVILNFTGFVKDTLSADDPRLEDLLEVEKASERAVALTRQLLAFSRKQVLQPVPLDLNHIARGMEKMLGRILGEDIRLVQTLDPELGVTLADPGQIEQVLMNLVVNARDAMPKGGQLTIETFNLEAGQVPESALAGLPNGSFVAFAVTDTGCGMDERTLEHIFEPFFTTKEKGRGTGLGLSTVFGIVKQSGGDIQVTSRPGKGTRITVILPRIIASGTAGMVMHDMVPKRATGTETILLVEDEDGLRNVARRILSEAGYTVLSASCGREALAAHEREAAKIQLVLTDVIMPEMSGTELAERLKQRSPGIRILYISGYTQDTIVKHGILDPTVHFLAKPFTADTLRQKVREVLDLAPATETRNPG